MADRPNGILGLVPWCHNHPSGHSSAQWDYGPGADLSTMSNTMLRVISLNKAFGGLRATRDVSLEVVRGEFRAIIGPNGAGKSTLFNLISGFVTPDGGSIFLDDNDVTG